MACVGTGWDSGHWAGAESILTLVSRLWHAGSGFQGDHATPGNPDFLIYTYKGHPGS
jgi:hypothetical protein